MMCISNQWQCPWYEKLSRQPVLGRRNDAVCLQLKALLKPFGITRYYTALFLDSRVVAFEDGVY